MHEPILIVQRVGQSIAPVHKTSYPGPSGMQRTLMPVEGRTTSGIYAFRAPREHPPMQA